MRGRTLKGSFVILDEAQNTTPRQLRMFLTRIGAGSRVVVCGDCTQTDLPYDDGNSLAELVHRVRQKPNPDVKVIEMTAADQSRDELVRYFDELMAGPRRGRR